MKKLFPAIVVFIAIVLMFCYRPSINLDKLKGMYTDESSEFVLVDGMDVHYQKKGSGFPVLLIHGTSASLHTWEHWQDEMANHFTTYSVDLPGCGLTGPHPDDDYTINTFLKFLETFTGKLGIDSFYVAGNSLGGHIAWEYARINPKIAKAVLVAPSGFYMEDRKVPLVFKLGRKKFFSFLVEGLNVNPLIHKSLKEVYYDDDQITKKLRCRYYDLIRRKGNRKAFVKKVASVEQSDKSELHDVKCPVLLQWGKEDLWIPVELSKIFMKNIPDNQLLIYESCGHVPQEELPERSVKDAIDFLLSS